MKVSPLTPNNIKTIDELGRLFEILINDIKTILNGGIIFSDNFNAKVTSAAFSTANTEIRVEHNLGRTPSGYLVFTRSANAVIYDGVTANTSQFLFLRASAPATINLMIF